MLRDHKLSCDNQEDEKEIHRLFGWLNLIDHADWLPPAIYFLVKYSDKTSDIKDLNSLIFVSKLIKKRTKKWLI